MTDEQRPKSTTPSPVQGIRIMPRPRDGEPEACGRRARFGCCGPSARRAVVVGCPRPECERVPRCEMTDDLRETLQAAHDHGTTVAADLAGILCLSPCTVNNRFRRIHECLGLFGRRGVDRRHRAVEAALQYGCIRRHR